uniref:pro-FMRFamide-related neuropeptide FF n=1 Tax=Panthera onca TaxID=9690 RepID=UPI002952CBE9|nr:pro-FMRFamide-related neuropeptide FF [Panthera onca]
MHLIKSLTPGLGVGGRRLGAGSPGGAMGGGPRRLLMEPCISIACSRSPLRLLWGGGRSTAGIRGGYSRRRADGRMDSRRAAVLLLVLLLTDWGCAERPGGQDEGRQILVEEDSRPRPLQEAQTPGSFLHSLLQAMQRHGRSSAFRFQPQRFGRNTRGSWSSEQLGPRAREELSAPFWSLAAPQRFGKK